MAGCGDFFRDLSRDLERQGPLGRFVDRPAPPVMLAQGGPTGVLIDGPVAPELPDPAVDKVVAASLREWLTFPERRSLAVASERAASGASGIAVTWRAQNGGDALTATGSATAIADVYRSTRGQVCRDIAQRFDKNDEPHAQTVALCRDMQVGGMTLWLIGAAD